MINVIGSNPNPKTTNKTTSPKPGTTAPTSPISSSANPMVKPQKPTKAIKKIFKTKKKINLKIILGVAFLILLVVGTIAGFVLTKVQQDIRQQAAVPGYACISQGAGSCSNVGMTSGSGSDCGSGCASNEFCCIPTTAATATPTVGACDPATHCCDPNGCTRWRAQ